MPIFKQIALSSSQAFMVLAVLGSGIYIGYTYSDSEHDRQQQRMEKAFNSKIRSYEQKLQSIQDQQEKELVAYKEQLAALRSTYSYKLLQSDKRSQLYQRQASGTKEECRKLAEHAQRLDRRLTEGVRLVEELTAIIKFRDTQLSACANTLLDERHLYGTK